MKGCYLCPGAQREIGLLSIFRSAEALPEVSSGDERGKETAAQGVLEMVSMDARS